MNLSVLLVVPRGYAAFAQTLEHLRRQTVRDRLELVFVVAERWEPPADLAEFGGVQVLELGPLADMGEPLAAAVRQARAPVVVVAEDHSFPEPHWAEQLIRAHEGPYAAVGPAIVNGNPEGLVSWVNLFCTHGAYTGWTAPFETSHLPGYNTSYKRQALLDLGAELGPLFNSEMLLCQRLVAAGHRLLLDPAARVRHLQWSYPLSLSVTQFICMRYYAATRSSSWPRARRWLYCLASPLLPFLRLRQMLPDLLRARSAGDYWPQILPLLLFALGWGALGEAAGYALGEGGAGSLRLRLDAARDRLSL